MDISSWDTGQWIIIILCAFLLVWYVIAGYFNRKRGIIFYRWLRDGLELLGGDREMHWIGSSGSGGQIIIKNAEPPCKTIDVVFLLETRELLPLWLINLIRKKQDEVIIKAILRNTSKQEIEVARSGDREFSRILALDQKPAYSQVPTTQNFQIAQRGGGNPETIKQLEKFLSEDGDQIIRLSLQRKTPHLVIRISLSKAIDKPSEDFFSSLINWLQNI